MMTAITGYLGNCQSPRAAATVPQWPIGTHLQKLTCMQLSQLEKAVLASLIWSATLVRVLLLST